MNAPDYLTVALIANTHGIRGELKLLAKTDFPEERFAKGAHMMLFPPAGADGAAPQPIEVTVESARPHKNVWIVKLKEFHEINQVERFKGGFLKVSVEDQLELEENEYYYHQIVGCTVVDEDGETLGTIKEILTPGANDVWVVKRPQGADLLLPYIEEVVLDVDVEAKRVVVRLMEGLL